MVKKAVPFPGPRSVSLPTAAPTPPEKLGAYLSLAIQVKKARKQSQGHVKHM